MRGNKNHKVENQITHQEKGLQGETQFEGD
jgi:hypothetical protein